MVIANCVVLGNDIFLEHVLYNTSAMLKQLSFCLWEEASRFAADPPAGWPRTDKIWNELRTSAAPPRPISKEEQIEGFDADAFARSIHDNIWNGDGSSIKSVYLTDFFFEGTTDRKFSGTNAYREYVDELRTTFPDLKMQVDEVYWMGNETDGCLISTRWSAEGTHLGKGFYRTPTGEVCQIWGVTQWRVHNGKIEKEWQLFNEFDLMMQISVALRK